jgi:hypothetical protein
MPQRTVQGAKRTSCRGQSKSTYLVIFVELDAKLILYEVLLWKIILMELRVYYVP